MAELSELEVRTLLLQISSVLAALGANGHTKPAAPAVLAEPRLLTLPQVAERLSVPKSYAYELARRGHLPTIRFGKYIRVLASDLEKWVEQREDRS